jgi:type I restriction enzyme S subunit
MSSNLTTTATQKEAKPALVPKLRFPEFHGAEGWKMTPLERCLDYQQPTPYLVKDERYNPAFKTPVLTAGKTFILGNTNEEHGIFTDGLPVIIFDDFTTATQFVDFPFKAKSSAMKILQAKNGADIKFMFEALQNLSFEVGAHERHWISTFAPMLVPVPSPDEQNKIAECLSSVDELIAAQVQKVDALKIHKKGLMQQLFPREGETQPRLRFPEFQNAREWAVKRVDEQGSVLAGKALAVDAPGPQRPYLRTKNVLDGAIDISDVLTMPMSDAEFTRFEILDGDVLLNEGQSLELVGRASIYHGELCQRCAMQNALLRFRAFPSTSAEFASQYFRQCQKDGTFSNLATKTTSVAHLGSSRFSALELAWPSLPEQQRIASCLSSLDALITAETQKHEALKTHKRGLMQQLFPSPEEATP